MAIAAGERGFAWRAVVAQQREQERRERGEEEPEQSILGEVGSEVEHERIGLGALEAPRDHGIRSLRCQRLDGMTRLS